MLIYILPLELRSTVDKKTGEITNVQLLLKELSPTNAPVKVFGQPAEVLNDLQAYIDAKQPIALPIRQGTLDNGNVWRSLDDADILPVSADFVRKKQMDEFNRLKLILYPETLFDNDVPNSLPNEVKTSNDVKSSPDKQTHSIANEVKPNPKP